MQSISSAYWGLFNFICWPSECRWDLVSWGEAIAFATTITLLGFLKFWNAALRLHFWVREKERGREGLYIGNLMLGQATFGEKKIPQRPTTSEQATHTTVEFSTSSWHLYRIWSLILFVLLDVLKLEGVWDFKISIFHPEPFVRQVLFLPAGRN